MSIPATYRAKLNEYDGLIRECEAKIEKLEKTKKEKEELLKKLDGLNLPSKLSAIVQLIEDAASKLAQSSKYMTNIRLMKDKNFDDGKLGQCGSEFASQTDGINALKDEIEEKINTTWPEEIKKIKIEIAEIEREKANYSNFKAATLREYKRSLANDESFSSDSNGKTTRQPPAPAGSNNRVFNTLE